MHNMPVSPCACSLSSPPPLSLIIHKGQCKCYEAFAVPTFVKLFLFPLNDPDTYIYLHHGTRPSSESHSSIRMLAFGDSGVTFLTFTVPTVYVICATHHSSVSLCFTSIIILMVCLTRLPVSSFHNSVVSVCLCPVSLMKYPVICCYTQFGAVPMSLSFFIINYYSFSPHSHVLKVLCKKNF